MNSNGIIAIIANGESLGAERLRKLIEDADLVIAADGGLKTCKNANIKPDIIVGDLDSSGSLLKYFSETKVKHISDQNSTDLEKAIAYAKKLDPSIFRFISVFGLRADHTMANMILFQNFDNKYDIEVYDNFGVLRLLKPGVNQVSGKVGNTVSLFTFNGIKNLKLSGFKYPLVDYSHTVSFFGISNEFVSETCIIEFENGPLFLYELYS